MMKVNEEGDSNPPAAADIPRNIPIHSLVNVTVIKFRTWVEVAMQ